jgi:predicted MFS family arabinose efflux permease
MPTPATLTRETRWRGVGYGICLGFVAAYFQFKVPPVLPTLFDAFAYDPVVAGGFMSIFAVAGMAVSIRVGRAIQRNGTGRYIAGAFALLIAGSVLGIALPEFGWVMLAARLIEGFGAAILAVCMPAYANMNAGPRHLPIVIGMQSCWIPVGQLVANAIAQPSVAAGVWQPVWWGGIVAVGAMAAWSLWIARDPAIVIGGNGRPADATLRSEAPMTALEHRAMLAAVALFFLWQAQFMAYFTWLPLFLVEVHGIGADTAVLINQLPVVVLLVFALATGFALRAGIGVTTLLTWSLVLQAAGWLLIPWSNVAAVGIISLVAWGCAAGICPTCLWALPSMLLGGHRAGTHAFGMVLSGRYLGILAGPVVAAALLDWRVAWSMIALLFGGFTLLTIVVALGFGSVARRVRAAPAG